MTEIRERFGLSETRFLQAVNAVLDDPRRVAALEPAVAALARRLDVQRQKHAAMRRPAPDSGAVARLGLRWANVRSTATSTTANEHSGPT